MTTTSRIFKRVMIMGGSGVGKSHLAMRLSALSGLPRYHMDQLSWQPGFVHRSTEELDRLTTEIHAAEHWIIEGGHYETSLERAQRADLLLVLAPNPMVQVMQIVLRSWRYSGMTRPGMTEGCVQRFGPQTVSAVQYALQSNRFHRDRWQEVVDAASQLEVLRLNSRAGMDRLLADCRHLPGERGFTLSRQDASNPQEEAQKCA